MLTTASMSWDEVMHAPSPQPHAMDHELLKQAQSRSSTSARRNSAFNIGAFLYLGACVQIE